MQKTAQTLNMNATGIALNGKVFTSESEAAFEASTYFGTYVGGIVYITVLFFSFPFPFFFDHFSLGPRISPQL